MTRVVLFTVTNLAVMVVLSIVLKVFGIDRGVGRRYYITVFVCEIVFAVLASIIVAWFSRQREFRADRGSAEYLGFSQPMMKALARLGGVEPGALPQSQSGTNWLAPHRAETGYRSNVVAGRPTEAAYSASRNRDNRASKLLNTVLNDTSSSGGVSPLCAASLARTLLAGLCCACTVKPSKRTRGGGKRSPSVSRYTGWPGNAKITRGSRTGRSATANA